MRRQDRQAGASDAPTFRLRGLPSIGWMLGERPGAELVFGQVGKPWKLRGTRIDPDGEPAAIVTMETRVMCTDQDSRRRFRRYWLVVGPCSHLLRRTALGVFSRKLEGPR